MTIDVRNEKSIRHIADAFLIILKEAYFASLFTLFVNLLLRLAALFL